MSFEFHKDQVVYFETQYENAKNYLVPFIEQQMSINSETRVLEIGCGQGGVLKAFIERGMKAVGVDLNQSKIQTAKEFLKADIDKGNISFVLKNIYDVDIDTDFKGKFNLIILKDSIEHIHDQRKIIAYLRNFLLPGGQIFFGFPPWYMPFGGHQQICKNKLLSLAPYTHLLPMPLYKALIRAFGESKEVLNELVELKTLGISIERFEKIVKQENYHITQRTWYLINPIYKYKFGLAARKQFGLIAAIPFIRNFFTTAAFYLIEDKK
jgi:SAM-dependent methyltransferase